MHEYMTSKLVLYYPLKKRKRNIFTTMSIQFYRLSFFIGTDIQKFTNEDIKQENEYVNTLVSFSILYELHSFLLLFS